MFKLPVATAFDTYTVGKKIGEGGSGAVYEAHNSAGELVALKCLKPNLASTKRKRFKNEVLFGQRHQHPNIISVIDSGAAVQGKDTISFYVMPFYPNTLRHLIEKGIPSASVLPLFSKILDGVEAAHLLGVNHRDLKPENILYNKVPVIADFGAAEFTEDELYTVVETKPGERIANFQYAAPEQRTRGAAVDHHADIFALGLMLNEMFTREVPSGTGARLISSVSAEHAYLDELVELMRRQIPTQRPDSISSLKRQLAGRANEFVTFQKLNALKTTVVPVTSPDVTPPVRAVGVDYKFQSAYEGSQLVFTLEPKPSGDWIAVFNSLSHHTGITSLLGRGPETVRFPNGNAVVMAREHEIDQATEFFKQWVEHTNRLLPGVLEAAERKRENEERERIRKAVEAEQVRLNVLERARKALG